MDALKSQNHKLESDIARLQAELVKTKNKLQNVETESNQLNTKLSFELHQSKEYLYQKESEVVKLRQDMEQLTKQMQS